LAVAEDTAVVARVEATMAVAVAAEGEWVWAAEVRDEERMAKACMAAAVYGRVEAEGPVAATARVGGELAVEVEVLAAKAAQASERVPEMVPTVAAATVLEVEVLVEVAGRAAEAMERVEEERAVRGMLSAAMARVERSRRRSLGNRYPAGSRSMPNQVSRRHRSHPNPSLAVRCIRCCRGSLAVAVRAVPWARESAVAVAMVMEAVMAEVGREVWAEVIWVSVEGVARALVAVAGLAVEVLVVEVVVGSWATGK